MQLKQTLKSEYVRYDEIFQGILNRKTFSAKERIFSQFNNSQVYTVISKEYAPYFGLNECETKTLLEAYGLDLNDKVREMYDGYQIGEIEMYNPWSVINYAKTGRLESYWIKTLANFLVKTALKGADRGRISSGLRTGR